MDCALDFNRSLPALILGVTLVGSVVHPDALVAQDAYRRCPRVSNPDDEEADARGRRICDEFTRLGAHDWAGSYTSGIAAFLTIAPDCGFVAYENISMQFISLIDHGDLTSVDSDVIRPSPFRDPGTAPDPATAVPRRRFGGISDEMCIVRWDDYRFLVPRDAMLMFCNFANADLPVSIQFYLRGPGLGSLNANLPFDAFIKFPPSGLPDVAREFRDHLLLQAIDATVIEVQESRTVTIADPMGRWERHVTVTLDAGSRAGLHPGMWLFVPERAMAVVAIVDSVTESQAIATIRTNAQSNSTCDPQIGDAFTTRPFVSTGGPQKLSHRQWELHRLIDDLIRVDPVVESSR